jgi:hypothetical protein
MVVSHRPPTGPRGCRLVGGRLGGGINLRPRRNWPRSRRRRDGGVGGAVGWCRGRKPGARAPAGRRWATGPGRCCSPAGLPVRAAIGQSEYGWDELEREKFTSLAKVRPQNGATDAVKNNPRCKACIFLDHASWHRPARSAMPRPARAATSSVVHWQATVTRCKSSQSSAY